jgi:hypothetical protein
MENIQPDTGKRPELAIFADIFEHRCEICCYGIQSLDDVAQLSFERIHAGPESFPLFGNWFGRLWWAASVQDRVDVLGMPTQGGRERFQGPRAPASLNDVVLEFADGRPRDMRTFCKLALPPAEFIHPLVDGLGNGRPVLHLFLRAPPRRRD